MKLDSPRIRRLRDRLLANDAPVPTPEGSAPTTGELLPSQQAAIERIAPLAEVLFLTMAADGEIARSESRAIRNAIGALTGDLLPAHAVESFLAHLEALLAEQGPEARLEAIASRFALNKPDAEAAFSLAAAIALSDGEIALEERSLIDTMRRYFGIPATRAEALLDGASTSS